MNISAAKGLGINLLLETLVSTLAPSEGKEDEFVSRERHLKALNNALSILQDVDFNLFKRSPELLAEEYRRACTELEFVSGEYTTEEILGDIFSRFCIGK